MSTNLIKLQSASCCLLKQLILPPYRLDKAQDDFEDLLHVKQLMNLDKISESS